MEAGSRPSRMARVYRTITGLVIGILGGLYPVSQLHLPVLLELSVVAFYLFGVVSLSFLYIRSLETEMGVSILRRPYLDLLLETNDTERIRDVFYSISRRFASTYQT